MATPRCNPYTTHHHFPGKREPIKYAILIARLLLGLMFFVFGLNILLHFLKQPPMSGDAGTFATLLASSNYMSFVGIFQLVAGLLLLVGRYVPLALTLLAPILVNILLFHFLLAHEGAAGGLVATALELFLLFAYRRSFYPLLAAIPEHA